MASTYIAKSTSVAFAASKSMLDIFNPASSGKILRIYRVWTENNQQSGNITGVTAILKLYRITASSGGVTVVPQSYDSTNTALGTVTAGVGRTVTTSSLFRNYFISNDEPIPLTGTNDEWQQYKHVCEVWNSSSRLAQVEPIVCREGQGISLYNSTSTTVGNIDVFIEFTVV